MLDFVIFAVTFVLLLLGAVVYLYPGSKFSTSIPGMDPADPREGNFPDIARAGSMHEFLTFLHDRYGAIAHFWMGSRMVVSIASADLFKQHNKVFDRPPELFRLFEPLIGAASLQYANGMDGRARRQKYDRSYSHAAVVNYYPTFHQVGNELTKKWSNLLDEQHIPLCQHMVASAIKMITITSYGDFFKKDESVLEFRKMYDICWTEMERRLTGSIPKENSPEEKRFKKALSEIHSTMRQIIAARKEDPPSSAEHVFLDTLMQSDFSEDQVLSDAVSFLVGGFHTSGFLMVWAMYFLASHPECQEKVYQELMDVVGPTADIEPATFSQLKYTRQVLDETLRCSVLAPWAARYQDFSSELGGHVIPSKTPIIHALGVSLQDKKVYSEPNSFDPDRFSEENIKARDDLAFQPFGFAGKRKCPGYRFAYAEVTILLACVLRKLKVNMVEGQVVTPVYGLITRPEEEIWITVEKRGREE